MKMSKDKNYKVKHVVCSTDDNYVQHCCAMLCSLLENNRELDFVVHIVISSLKEENTSALKGLFERYSQTVLFHQIDNSCLCGVKYRKKRPLTEAAYYRILLSSILDYSISTVLYLDSDLLILGDISPLFDLDIKGYALAAVKDIHCMSDEHRMQLSFSYRDHYFCSGVMLINLDYWRSNNSESLLLDFAKKERKVFFHDQDALNAVFHRNWFELAPKWNKFNSILLNASEFLSSEDEIMYRKNPVILHYSTLKPWYDIKFLSNRKLYWEYVDKSKYKDVRVLSVKNKREVYRKILGYYIGKFLYSVHLFFIYTYMRKLLKTFNR